MAGKRVHFDRLTSDSAGESMDSSSQLARMAELESLALEMKRQVQNKKTRRLRSTNLTIAELTEGAINLAKQSSGVSKIDHTPYVRMLASKDSSFPQKIANKISSLQQISTRSHPRGVLEGANIEGFISHHKDMIILDSIDRAKNRVDEDIETLQRTSWTWRQLMASKMGGTGTSSGSSSSRYDTNRILPIISITESASKQGESAVYPIPITSDLIESCPAAIRQTIHSIAAQSRNYQEFSGPGAILAMDGSHAGMPRSPLLLPFTDLSNAFTRDAGRNLDTEDSQYVFTLDLLAHMVGEITPSAHGPGAFCAMGFGQCSSSPETVHSMSSLTDGAVQYFQALYHDAAIPELADANNPLKKTPADAAPSWRYVYGLLRKGKLQSIASYLASAFSTEYWEQSASHARDDSSIATQARKLVLYLLSLDASYSHGASGLSIMCASGDDKDLSDACCFIKPVLQDDGSSLSTNDPYMYAVLSLLMAVRDLYEDETCSGAMPGLCSLDQDLAKVAEPDLESFLWAKLWIAKYRRFVYSDQARYRARRDSDPAMRRSMGGSPSHTFYGDLPYVAGEKLLYDAVRENGGAASFESDFQSPHAYVRTLVCCQQFGEAVKYLSSCAVMSPRFMQEGMSLCCAFLYYGLIASSVPLSISPMVGVAATERELYKHSPTPASMIRAYTQCCREHGVRSLDALQHCTDLLVLLAPPRAVEDQLQRELERHQPNSLSSEENRQKIVHLSDLVSSAHNAFATATEDFLVILEMSEVTDMIGASGLLRSVYPQCPIEVIMLRAGSRMANTNQNIESAIFYYESIQRLPQLCAEVAHMLSQCLLPATSPAEKSVRDHWYNASAHVLRRLEERLLLVENEMPGALSEQQIYWQLHNLRCLRDMMDAEACADGVRCLEVIDRLQLPPPAWRAGHTAHLPRTLAEIGAADRRALESFLEPLDIRVQTVYRWLLRRYLDSLQ